MPESSPVPDISLQNVALWGSLCIYSQATQHGNGAIRITALTYGEYFVAQQISPELRQQKSGDALAAAFELVATPALFAFFGWRIDSWLGTSPVFILILTIFTASYSIYRLLAQYNREMAAHAEARNNLEDAKLTGPPQ